MVNTPHELEILDDWHQDDIRRKNLRRAELPMDSEYGG